MISFLIGFLAFLNAFFRSRYSLGLEEIVIRFRDGGRIDRIAGDSNYRSG
jgi:hypothetical protein